MPPGTGSAVILAGGMGKRIGYDKKEIVLAGEKLIDRLIERLGACFAEIIVSSNTPFARSGVITVRDELGEGPLAGIYSALKTARNDSVYVCACDMPFVSARGIGNLRKIIASGRYGAAAYRRADGFIEPFGAFYHKSALSAMEEQLKHGDYKMSRLLSKLDLYCENCDEIEYEKEFFNINYAEDLFRAADMNAVLER
ncbi:MAG: molybdenum cofactor guanylyltransferase [Spirochaetaceae bacterium]|jgi:molybdopterin-guanine dinucleotide biosynthesis protein A|nr:molybdenum cofactor guanylyltransferase [Spirochaetaceae bacterium]